jgi:hypothetical protein
VAFIRLFGDGGRFSASAPKSVEMTIFHQPDRHRYLVTFVNFQKDMPNIPIDDITVALKLGGEKVHRVVALPTGKNIDHKSRDGVTTIAVPRLETLAMFAVETM